MDELGFTCCSYHKSVVKNKLGQTPKKLKHQRRDKRVNQKQAMVGAGSKKKETTETVNNQENTRTRKEG